MKKISITIFSVLLLHSCSGNDDFIPQSVIENVDPTAPSLLFPTNNLVCTNFNLEFDWNVAVDADGDSVSYTVDIATDSEFTTVLFSATTTETGNTFTLEKGTTYFWRVKAIDSEGNDSDYSTTQTFFTEPDAETNTIPNAPELVSPFLGEKLFGSTVNLDWDATDTDNDSLSYDVYFGDSNPPVLFAENIDITMLDATVSSGTTYYWRVVVKDSHQSAIIGQIWNFRTE